MSDAPLPSDEQKARGEDHSRPGCASGEAADGEHPGSKPLLLADAGLKVLAAQSRQTIFNSKQAESRRIRMLKNVQATNPNLRRRLDSLL